MGSAFDTMQAAMFKTVQTQFGYDTTWQPLAGGAPYAAKVLFLTPTDIQKLMNVDYMPENWQMEYFEGDLPGLKQSVDTGAVEVVIIDGTAYDVRQVLTDYDGKNFKALLTPTSDT